VFDVNESIQSLQGGNDPVRINTFVNEKVFTSDELNAAEALDAKRKGIRYYKVGNEMYDLSTIDDFTDPASWSSTPAQPTSRNISVPSIGRHAINAVLPGGGYITKVLDAVLWGRNRMVGDRLIERTPDIQPSVAGKNLTEAINPVENTVPPSTRPEGGRTREGYEVRPSIVENIVLQNLNR
jgi:hypothetical protein